MTAIPSILSGPRAHSGEASAPIANTALLGKTQGPALVYITRDRTADTAANSAADAAAPAQLHALNANFDVEMAKHKFGPLPQDMSEGLDAALQVEPPSDSAQRAGFAPPDLALTMRLQEAIPAQRSANADRIAPREERLPIARVGEAIRQERGTDPRPHPRPEPLAKSGAYPRTDENGSAKASAPARLELERAAHPLFQTAQTGGKTMPDSGKVLPPQIARSQRSGDMPADTIEEVTETAARISAMPSGAAEGAETQVAPQAPLHGTAAATHSASLASPQSLSAEGKGGADAARLSAQTHLPIVTSTQTGPGSENALTKPHNPPEPSETDFEGEPSAQTDATKRTAKEGRPASDTASNGPSPSLSSSQVQTQMPGGDRSGAAVAAETSNTSASTSGMSQAGSASASGAPPAAAPAVLPSSTAGFAAGPAASETALGRQLETLIDNLSDIRSNSRTARGDMNIRHDEFGTISVGLERREGDLRATMSSRDPGFAPAAQTALASQQANLEKLATYASDSQSGGRMNDQSANPNSNSNGNSNESGLGQQRGLGEERDQEASQPISSLDETAPDGGSSEREAGADPRIDQSLAASVSTAGSAPAPGTTNLMV